MMRMLLIALLLSLPLAAMSAEDTNAPPKPSLSALSWLAGNWHFERNGRVVTEHWMSPEGGTMPGISRTVANGKTIEYEFVLIRMEASGDIVYVAKPSGQAEVTFKLVSVSKTEVVFENLNHDFPQRIRYALQTDGSLIAAIEGIQGGKLRRVTFPYHRTKH